MKPFYRHLNEELILQLTCIAADETRQSLAAATTLVVNFYTKDLQPVLMAFNGISKLETTDPTTFGDVQIKRDPDGTTTFQLGEYNVQILATFPGIGPIAFPEKGYIPLIFN